jgi:hypothetical protein
MSRRLRIHVTKGNYVIVLVNDFGGNLLRNDFAKQAIHRRSPGSNENRIIRSAKTRVDYLLRHFLH